MHKCLFVCCSYFVIVYGGIWLKGHVLAVTQTKCYSQVTIHSLLSVHFCPASLENSGLTVAVERVKMEKINK